MKKLLLFLLLPTLAFAEAKTDSAILAGGCFWCTEADFEKLPGVISAVSGYTGGKTANPTYQQVGQGGTGHTEAVEVTFDPAQVSYAQLLEHFWKNHDPTNPLGQFCDRGDSYRPAIFYKNSEQKKWVEESLDKLKASGRFKQIHTEISAAATFWPAEDYHQDYYKKNPLRYKFYRERCGRDRDLADLWKGSK